MTAWLDFAPTAFDRTARPLAVALFSTDEAVGLDGALFTVDGEPVAEAVAPVSAEQRAALEGERAELLARLSVIAAMLDT